MQQHNTQSLSGWGRTPAYSCKSWRAEQMRDCIEILGEANTPLIARSAGKAYGDAALQPEGVVHMHRMDKMIAYDADAGIITADAGVTLRDVMQHVIRDGWIVPVLSGTQHVSLGGALAANIHGKNQFSTGNFADYVLECRIMLADSNVVRCSSTKNADLFYATAGGMGMTGIILALTLQLTRITTIQLESHTRSVASMAEMLRCFEESKNDAEYMVGWIDHFATKAQLGRGVFEKASHVHNGDARLPLPCPAPAASRSIPDIIPSFVLNRYSMALYNRLRFGRFSAEWQEARIGFESFFHPLDNLSDWNRLYGKAGFYQYQCIVPNDDDTLANLTTILSTIHERGCFSFLAVMKYHRAHRSQLSFDINGYSIALDFPNTAKVVALQATLNQMVADMGGRVYLAKDALLSRTHFEQMYANELPDWKATLQHYDPEGRFLSSMAARLGFKDGAA
jgi:decaprenylphospho-beta-D-ribofuranose 2-oxidase